MKQFFQNYLRGILIGCGEIIPGLGASTIAYSIGVYKEFLGLIADIGTLASELTWYMLGKSEKTFRDVLSVYNWKFAFPIAAGAVTVILLLSSIAEKLFTEYTSIINAFICGCLLAVSASIYIKLYKKYTLRSEYITLLLSLITSVLLLKIVPSSSEPTVSLALIAGTVAAIAIVLPGLSFTLILAAFGMYEYLLKLAKNLLTFKLAEVNIPVLVVFVIAVLVSVIAGSKLLKYMYEKHHSHTQMSIVGFMLGALTGSNPFAFAETPNFGYDIPVILLVSGVTFLIIFTLEQRFAR